MTEERLLRLRQIRGRFTGKSDEEIVLLLDERLASAHRRVNEAMAAERPRVVRQVTRTRVVFENEEALLRSISGALRNQIHEHGTITAFWIGSAAKRVLGALRSLAGSQSSPEEPAA